MSICFFIGHRDTPADVYSQIVAEVERPILCGVTEFVVGHYGAFDRMAARAVREAKRQYPEIRLILLPYYETSTSKYGTDFDGIIFPEGQETIPKRAAIIRANQYMIDHCDFLIMYARHTIVIFSSCTQGILVAIHGSLWIMHSGSFSVLANRKSST